MMHGILKKTEFSSKALRTDEVEGEFDFYPTVGKMFYIIGKSLDPALQLRLVKTSLVQEIIESNPGNCRFRTRNSVYVLTNDVY